VLALEHLECKNILAFFEKSIDIINLELVSFNEDASFQLTRRADPSLKGQKVINFYRLLEP
jgi:hypothetical protein